MGKILLIDDDRQIRRVARMMLERVGHAVTEAADGFEAMRVFTNVWPDVVLLDMRMPGKNGLETLAEIRAVSPAVRVVLMSGSDETDKTLSESLGKHGRVVHLPKPFVAEDLSAAITAVLALGTD
jgi:CheY-like chemotaxis protein